MSQQGTRRDLRDAALGLLIGLATVGTAIIIDMARSSQEVSTTAQRTTVAVALVVILAGVTAWRRAAPRFLAPATVSAAALAPLSGAHPWVWAFAGLAAIAWLYAARPAWLVAGAALFWPLAAIAVYTVDLGDMSAWLLMGLVAATALWMWSRLPHAGHWRRFPAVALGVLSIGGLAVGALVLVRDGSWKGGALAAGALLAAVSVWRLYNHPAWAPGQGGPAGTAPPVR